MVPMIYVAGNDEVHTADPHPLDAVFSNQDHEKILKALQNKNEKYLIVEG